VPAAAPAKRASRGANAMRRLVFAALPGRGAACPRFPPTY